MPVERVKVTTEGQLRYYLECGEIVMYAASDGTQCVFRKVSDDHYECLMQPRIGSGVVMTTNTLEKVVQAFNHLRDDFGVTFWVLPGAYVESKPTTVLDKVVDFFRSFREKGRC